MCAATRVSTESGTTPGRRAGDDIQGDCHPTKFSGIESEIQNYENENPD
jgi:hypothetical protein